VCVCVCACTVSESVRHAHTHRLLGACLGQISGLLFRIRAPVEVVDKQHAVRQICQAEARIVFGQFMVDNHLQYHTAQRKHSVSASI